MAIKEISLHEAFQIFIKDSTKGKHLMPSGKRLSDNSIKNYSFVLKLIKSFEEKKGIQYRICIISKPSLKTISREQNYWKRFYESFTNYLYKDLQLLDSYVASSFKLIRSIFNYLTNQKCLPIGNYHKKFRIPNVSIEPIVLLPEQLSFLITNKEFKLKLPERFYRALDIFILGCCTGLRVSDLLNLERKNLIFQSTTVMLNLYTQKTGTRVLIPLPDYCIEIIDRYKNKRSNFILPRIQLYTLNSHLKEIAKAAGWNWTHPKVRTRQGKLFEIKNKAGASFCFYEHISAHTMRRTAITNLLMLGVDESIVRRVSGHSATSKEFHKYVALSQAYLNEQLKTAYAKMALNTKCIS